MKTANLTAPSLSTLVRTLLTALVLTGVAAPAAAQWYWKDANGRMVVSDRPPPPSVPIRNIIKSPGGQLPATSVPAPAPAAPAAASKAGGASMAEKELEFRKRQIETAEAAKKAEEAATQAKANAQQCTALRANLAMLESGGRVIQPSEKGERNFMNDEQRTSEIARMREQISQHCAQT